jgi:predicted RNase H-like nuclease (RuvC/YqgF family)
VPNVKQIDSEAEIKRLNLYVKVLEAKVKALEAENRDLKTERDKYKKKFRRLKDEP